MNSDLQTIMAVATLLLKENSIGKKGSNFHVVWEDKREKDNLSY